MAKKKNDSRDFLFEIGTEEIPGDMLKSGMSQMIEILKQKFRDYNLTFKNVKGYYTPRRIGCLFEGLPPVQPHQTKLVIGPPVTAAYDENGNLTKAAIGFVKSQGVEAASLKKVNTRRGECVAAERYLMGRNYKEFLPEAINAVLNGLQFKKSMRWSSFDERFIRPIHWLLALYGSEVVGVSFAGVKSASFTMGHRFAGNKRIALKEPSDYEKKLKACFVIPDYEERRAAVLRAIGEIEVANGFRVAVYDDLIESVTNLTEFPVPAVGRFDEKFLALPKDVLITSMKTHQKFFPVFAPEGGILPYFVVVTNSPQGDIAEIVRGNERVLNARLNDAMFFYKEDMSRPLESYVERLSGRIFLTGLGTMKDKTDRLMRLAPEICGILDCGADTETVKRAAMLAKADLATSMVGEFPELQGIIGMEYALKSGETLAVAVAVYEHYLPRFAGDEIPRTNAGKILSIAEKIDTIVGCFAINLIPSGSEDPYALRRSAGGILKIMLDGGYETSLESLLKLAFRTYRDAIQIGDEAAHISRIEEFFYSRLESILTADYGIPTEFALAVLGARFERPYEEMKAIHSPKSILDRSATLLYFYRNPATAEKFEPLMVTYRRVLNIMKGQEARDFTPLLFRQEEEENLFNAFSGVEGRVVEAFRKRKYEDILHAMLELQPVIHQYFEKVFVMVEDEQLKGNRLGMLYRIGSLFRIFADFAKISQR